MARRWEETAVDLYHVDDVGRSFFVEVGEAAEQILVLRSFMSVGPLEHYSHYVQLPEL